MKRQKAHLNGRHGACVGGGSVLTQHQSCDTEGSIPGDKVTQFLINYNLVSLSLYDYSKFVAITLSTLDSLNFIQPIDLWTCIQRMYFRTIMRLTDIFTLLYMSM